MGLPELNRWVFKAKPDTQQVTPRKSKLGLKIDLFESEPETQQEEDCGPERPTYPEEETQKKKHAHYDQRDRPVPVSHNGIDYMPAIELAHRKQVKAGYE